MPLIHYKKSIYLFTPTWTPSPSHLRETLTCYPGYNMIKRQKTSAEAEEV